MMTTAMGVAVGDLLHDPAVEELRANPDGKLWFVREGARHNTGKTLSDVARRQLIHIVAHAVGVTVDEDNPSFPAELPESGYRFHAIVPPQSPDGPTFVIRKKPIKVYSLDDYVAAGIMTAEQAAFIRQAIADRQNILVGGGTGSGKTTLTNAILKEIGLIAGRVLTVEDTLELQVEADEVVRQRTVRNGDAVRRTMQDVVRDMLRLSPDRIIVGEVRGPEAMDLIQGWNTGHPGGVATIHCNSAPDALERLEDLLIQGGYTPVPRQIAKAINIIVFIGPVTVDTPHGVHVLRRVRDIVRVTGINTSQAGAEYAFERPFSGVSKS
ncbi:MAG: type II/IV secretion system family protein [Xanthomonadales bacterium PRO7]|nr:type II/IV secretion system family protein [Xanthomonadales bacterium PRO7]